MDEAVFTAMIYWVSGKVGELQQTVNLLPMAELVRIHPYPPTP
jgi:hypothetical protein